MAYVIAGQPYDQIGFEFVQEYTQKAWLREHGTVRSSPDGLWDGDAGIRVCPSSERASTAGDARYHDMHGNDDADDADGPESCDGRRGCA